MEMNIPGFTAELALSMTGRGYPKIVNPLTDYNCASVISAVSNTSGLTSTFCCLGHCVSSNCPSGCQLTCWCRPDYVLCDCWCGSRITSGQFMR
jgi:hypothetical protein